MTPILLYGIPNCSSVKKARAWLDEHQHPYTFVDFKKTPPSTELIQSWLTRNPDLPLINRKSTTWRTLTPAQQQCAQDPTQWSTLCHEFPSLIKRPLLDMNHTVCVGFDPQHYQEIFK